MVSVQMENYNNVEKLSTRKTVNETGNLSNIL